MVLGFSIATASLTVKIAIVKKNPICCQIILLTRTPELGINKIDASRQQPLFLFAFANRNASARPPFDNDANSSSVGITASGSCA